MKRFLVLFLCVVSFYMAKAQGNGSDQLPVMYDIMEDSTRVIIDMSWKIKICELAFGVRVSGLEKK